MMGKEGKDGKVAAPAMSAEQLRDMADRAYCEFIRHMKEPLCLGWEVKVKTGKFSIAELDAHCAAHQELGRHRGLAEAARMVREWVAALTAEKDKEIEHLSTITADKCGACGANLNRVAELEAEVAGLTRERDEWQAQTGAANGAFKRARDRAGQAEAELARLREQVRLADELVKSDGHTTKCRFAGCNCGGAERYAATRTNYMRLARAALESTTPQEEK